MAPRTFAPTSVKGANVTDEDACGATDAFAVSMSWPSTVNTTGTSVNGWLPLLLSPAVTVTRSCPENAARPNDTDGTDRFSACSVATDLVVSAMPSGNLASSEPLQPDFWKSLISTASR